MTSLSSFQRKTLAAILLHGGTAQADGGGYWKGSDGLHLHVDPEPGAGSGIVGILTIQALEKRGMLERVEAPRTPTYQWVRRLTDAGRAAAEFMAASP